MLPPNSQAPGRFRLDLSRYQLLDGGSPVRLERQPMELLILLAERKGQLVTRDEIAARLWSSDVFVDADRNINSIVRKLRQALNDDPDNPEFLETVVGKGYRFVGPLEVTPDPKDGSLEIASQEPRPQLRRNLLLAGVLGCLAIAFVSWFGLRASRSGGAVLTPARSIAILPLENLSGDTSQEYFADGMTEELTSQLAQARELRVIAHTSVRQYEGSRKSIPEIARELHVDAVIEGSVLRSGNRVRITAQLIRAPSDQVIWTNTYERDLRDVLSLQRDIAVDIAERVKIHLASRAASPFAGARPLDPEAHDLYLQGLFHYEQNTENDLKEAIADYQKAIARDPTYAEAYAGVAESYVELGVFYWAPPEAMPQAKFAALKALELNPNLSQAHVALGSVYYYYEWDWQAAEREAKMALALNPNDAYGRDVLASYYGTTGNFRDCLLEMQRARDLAPRSAEILGDTVFWAFFSRNYPLAIRFGESAIAAEPNNAFAQAFLGMAYAKQGDAAQALKHADLASKYDGGSLIASFRANVYALAGRKAEARAALKAVEKQRVEQYSCAYEIGAGYVLLGQANRGFDWLNNAYHGRSECMILLKVDPRLDSIRSDSRYKKLLRRVGLADSFSPAE